MQGGQSGLRARRVAGHVLFFAMLIIASFFASRSVSHFVAAQSLYPPDAAAPDNSGLNALQSLEGFLQLNESLAQFVNGPVVFGGSQSVSAGISNSAFLSGLRGVAGTATPPLLTDYTDQSAALYGYAESGGVSAGLYASAEGNSGAAFTASVIDGGFAAQFLGSSTATGSLFVEDYFAPAKSEVVVTDGIVGLTSANGISVTGGVSYGVQGYSETAAGILSVPASGTGTTVAHENSTDNVIVVGAYGTSVGASSKAGIQALASSGNGIEARVGSGLSAVAAVGEIVNPSVSGTDAAVFGSGGAFAALFEGDVVIENGSLYIGSFELTEARLADLITWCKTDSLDYCPDDYK